MAREGLTREEIEALLADAATTAAADREEARQNTDQPPVSPDSGETRDVVRDPRLRRFLDFPVTVAVRIGHAQVSVKDWLAVGVGSRVSLAESWRQPVSILINGHLVGRGWIVLVGNRFGIRVSQWGEEGA